MQGHRREDTDKPIAETLPWEPGDYGKVRGEWWIHTPDGKFYGDITNHTVTEHEDGTITASPSILTPDTGTRPQWHGYLEHGIWREV